MAMLFELPYYILYVSNMGLEKKLATFHQSNSSDCEPEHQQMDNTADKGEDAE
jgi:hypothetical protein